MDHAATAKRFEKNTGRQIVSFGYAHGPEGRAIIKGYIDPVIVFVTQTRAECPPDRKRPQPSLTPELWRLMEGVPDDVLAWAIFRGTLNAIWTRKPDDSAALKARLGIGWEIWRECRRATYDQKVAAEISRVAVHKGTMQARERVERKFSANTALTSLNGTPCSSPTPATGVTTACAGRCPRSSPRPRTVYQQSTRAWSMTPPRSSAC